MRDVSRRLVLGFVTSAVCTSAVDISGQVVRMNPPVEVGAYGTEQFAAKEREAALFSCNQPYQVLENNLATEVFSSTTGNISGVYEFCRTNLTRTSYEVVETLYVWQLAGGPSNKILIKCVGPCFPEPNPPEMPFVPPQDCTLQDYENQAC